MSINSGSAVPTTVFTGFLGSGKTTIIGHLIDELQANGGQVIYIKNEIGDENVDAAIMQGKHIQTKELLNGCICCTLVGPFIAAVDEIIANFKPTRIIIEASGAADPAALALMIDSQPKLYRDGVIAIIDVVNFDGYIDLSVTAQNQTKFTDLIVFNKVEQVDLQRKQAVVGYVRELNTHAPIVEAAKGTLAAAVAFGLSSTELDLLLKASGFDEEHVSGKHHPHEHHLTQDGIESFTIELPDQLSQASLSAFIENLPTSVYRVKGIVTLDTGATTIVNKVGARLEFNHLDSPVETPLHNILVIIGFSVLAQRENIEKQLSLISKQ